MWKTEQGKYRNDLHQEIGKETQESGEVEVPLGNQSLISEA